MFQFFRRKKQTPSVCCRFTTGKNPDKTLLKTYTDTEHLSRFLFRCNECGCLFFYEFYEIVDYSGDGDDKIYTTFIHVEDERDADSFAYLPPFDLLMEMSKRPHIKD